MVSPNWKYGVPELEKKKPRGRVAEGLEREDKYVNYFYPVPVYWVNCFKQIIKLEVVIMKKLLVAAALVGVISLVSFSMVSAHGRDGNGPGKGYGNCDGYTTCNNWSYDEQDKEKVATFRAETKEARKQIAVKRSERRALMSQDNPDEKRVATLTGEIFDLKNLVDEKAKETFGDNPQLGHMPGRGGHGKCGEGPRNF